MHWLKHSSRKIIKIRIWREEICKRIDKEKHTHILLFLKYVQSIVPRKKVGLNTCLDIVDMCVHLCVCVSVCVHISMAETQCHCVGLCFYVSNSITPQTHSKVPLSLHLRQGLGFYSWGLEILKTGGYRGTSVSGWKLPEGSVWYHQAQVPSSLSPLWLGPHLGLRTAILHVISKGASASISLFGFHS